jgi:TonB family protein
VVDAVSDAKALAGPEELRPAAIASVKMWQFEPPQEAPRVKTVEVKYGFWKECPGPVSEVGEVISSGRLLDKNGQLVAVVDTDDYPSPPYPEKERKAGVEGTMVLSVSLDAEGHVREIHAAKSLSPSLDEAAIDTVRPWKFKRAGTNTNASLDDLGLEFEFRGTCGPN